MVELLMNMMVVVEVVFLAAAVASTPLEAWKKLR